MYYISPVKDEDKLLTFFYFEYLEKDYLQCPLEYINYLVDNESKNSLSAFL